jgi:hypothetical protein
MLSRTIRRPRLLCAALLGFLVTIPIPSIAQPSDTVPRSDWADGPYRPSGQRHTLGSLLEREFADAMSTCGIGNSLRRKAKGLDGFLGGTHEISRVPMRLQKLSTISRQMAPAQSSSLARLFSYVAAGNQDPFRTDSIVEERRLATDWLQAAELMVPGGASRHVETHSCASTIQSAADAKVNLAAGIATLAAATNAVHNTNTAQTLTIAEGEFVSPFHTFLTGPNSDPTTRLFGNLLAWDWYVRNPAQLTNGGRYRRSFRGVAIVRKTSGDVSTTLRGSFVAGVRVPVAQLDASIKGDYSRSDRTDSQIYLTSEYSFATSADSVSRIASLPTPTQIAAAVGQYFRTSPPVISNPEQNILVQNVPNDQTWVVEGIPDGLCNPQSWKLLGQETTGIEIRSITPRDRRSDGPVLPWRSCSIQIAYTGPQSLWSSNIQRDTTVRFSLVNRVRNGSDTAAVVLGPFQVQFTTRTSPQVSQYGQLTDQWIRADSTGVFGTVVRRRITWDDLKLRLDDAPGARISFVSGFSLDSLQLRCPGEDSSTDQFRLDLDGQTIVNPQWNPSLKVLSVPLTRQTSLGETVDLTNARECRLAGAIRLTIVRDGAPPISVSKPLPSPTLLYPTRGSATANPPVPGTPEL